MASARHVVLVHGAWHGAWCYAALQTELDRRGIPSIAIDLPGHGASTAPLTDMHGDARCVADTLAILQSRGIIDTVLVGHSYGGAVITQSANYYPAISHLVYLAAFALDNGESVLSALGSFPAHNVALNAAMQMHDDGTSTLNTFLAKDALYGSCEESVVTAALARLSPQPMSTMMQQVIGSPRDSIACTYVVCSQDKSIHPQHQQIMSQRCTNVITLDTDHSPFISRVEEIAELLQELALS